MPSPSTLHWSQQQLGRECVRFAIVGFLGFLVDFSVLVFCRDGLEMNCAMAATLGYLVGLLVAYLLNAHWVFETRRFDSRNAEFALFFGIGLMGLGVTQLIFGIGVGVMAADYRLVKLFAVAWVMVQNFVVRKTLLFSA